MQALDRRHATGLSWANAHRVEREHALEVLHIYSTAHAAVMRFMVCLRRVANDR